MAARTLPFGMHPPDGLNLVGQFGAAEKSAVIGQRNPSIADVGQNITLGRLAGGRERASAVCCFLPWVYLKLLQLRLPFGDDLNTNSAASLHLAVKRQGSERDPSDTVAEQSAPGNATLKRFKCSIRAAQPSRFRSPAPRALRDRNPTNADFF
jgi:hypothetical protein